MEPIFAVTYVFIGVMDVLIPIQNDNCGYTAPRKS